MHPVGLLRHADGFMENGITETLVGQAGDGAFGQDGSNTRHPGRPGDAQPPYVGRRSLMGQEACHERDACHLKLHFDFLTLLAAQCKTYGRINAVNGFRIPGSLSALSTGRPSLGGL
jgi:hypothetical protein